MPDVGTTLVSWSNTSASNSPSGGTTISTGLDDNLREIQGVMVRGLSHKGADIASATTTDLGAVEGLMHDITGTTTITGFGTVRAGIWKIVKFEGALTLTHNATSLILPNGVNITTANGDIAVMFSEGSGNWRCVSYFSATSAQFTAAASVAAHATTANPWVARNITLTGGAVTFTDIADAPYAGAVAWVKQNAAHTWTNGAVFDVQWGANYVAAADDWIRIYATTTSTFEVTIFPALGGGIVEIVAPTSLPAANSVVISSIPQGFSQLHLRVTGASCDTATRTLYVYETGVTTNYAGFYSNNGSVSVLTNVLALTHSTQAAGDTCNLSVKITGYQAGSYTRAEGNSLLSDATVGGSVCAQMSITTAMTSLTIIWSGSGNFDAGTYALYGIK